MMLSNISRTQAIGTWVATVAVLMVGSLTAGMDLTVSTSALWFFVGMVPPAIALILWHRTPAVTIADVLYSDASKKTADEAHRRERSR
jgi:hypothetical protein